jgi:hypothetical protein
VDEAVGLLTNENIFQGSEEPQQMQVREATVEDCSTWSKILCLCKSGFQGTAQLRRKGNAVVARAGGTHCTAWMAQLLDLTNSFTCEGGGSQRRISGHSPH